MKELVDTLDRAVAGAYKQMEDTDMADYYQGFGDGIKWAMDQLTDTLEQIRARLDGIPAK